MKTIARMCCVMILALGGRALAQEDAVARGTPYWWNACLQDDVVVLRGVFDLDVSAVPDVRLMAEQSLAKKYLDPESERPSRSLSKAFYCVKFKPTELIYISAKFKEMEPIFVGKPKQSGIAAFVVAMPKKDGTYSQPLIAKEEAVRVFRIQPLVSDRDFVFKASIQNTDLDEAEKLFGYLRRASITSISPPNYVK